MKILMVASEANPLVKVGGLGDVVYSLSKAYVKQNTTFPSSFPSIKH